MDKNQIKINILPLSPAGQMWRIVGPGPAHGP